MAKVIKRGFIVGVVAVILTSFMMGSSSLAESNQVTQAKTSPPPIEFGTYAFSGHTYLFSGIAQITDNGNQTATLSGTTFAYTTADNIGVRIYLQRWTGTSWVTEASKSFSDSNSLDVDGIETWDVESGYYYRAHTVHWVLHNGVYEEDELTTTSILMQ